MQYADHGNSGRAPPLRHHIHKLKLIADIQISRWFIQHQRGFLDHHLTKRDTLTLAPLNSVSRRSSRPFRSSFRITASMSGAHPYLHDQASLERESPHLQHFPDRKIGRVKPFLLKHRHDPCKRLSGIASKLLAPKGHASCRGTLHTG